MNGNDRKEKLTVEICDGGSSNGCDGCKKGWNKKYLKRSVPFPHNDDEIALRRVVERFIVGQGTDGTIPFIMFGKTVHPGTAPELFITRSERSKGMVRRLPGEELAKIELMRRFDAIQVDRQGKPGKEIEDRGNKSQYSYLRSLSQIRPFSDEKTLFNLFIIIR